MAGMYPTVAGFEPKAEGGDAFGAYKKSNEQVREYLVAVETVKIMQQKLKECYLRSGPNHFEDCKDLREKLWVKINTPNYGAAGPPRGVRARARAPRTPRSCGSHPNHASVLMAVCAAARQTSKYGINHGVPRPAADDDDE